MITIAFEFKINFLISYVIENLFIITAKKYYNWVIFLKNNLHFVAKKKSKKNRRMRVTV